MRLTEYFQVYSTREAADYRQETLIEELIHEDLGKN